MARTKAIGPVRGSDLMEAFKSAAGRLEEFRDAINALNVFPVPDGDTGTNMLLTMRSSVASPPDDGQASVSDVAAGLAKGAFYGARGNSGVILSQFFKGFADALFGHETLSPPDLVRAFDLATQAAYASVGEPVEGTMLTVIRRASEAVRDQAGRDQAVNDQEPNGGTWDVGSLFQTAFQAALAALAQTPEQLPILKQAGSVDSGGMGVAVIIGGALQVLSPGSTGDELAALAAYVPEMGFTASAATGKGHSPPHPHIDPGYLSSTTDTDWGFCTEFIIAGKDLDLGDARRRFQEMAHSTVVVGGGQAIRVHVHTADPGKVLEYASSLGDASNIKIENMDDQNSEFAAGHGAAPVGQSAVRSELAVLAVASGMGLANLFRDSGCAAVVDGGQTMNPSVHDLLGAVRRVGAKATIILPNNANILAAAQQAREIEPTLHVVPSRTVPQGVTALLCFNPADSLDNNLHAMTGSLSSVATVEVTQAVRDTGMNGINIKLGTFIGLVEGQLAATGDSAEDALLESLRQAGVDADCVVTVYAGAGVSPGSAIPVARTLEDGFPGIQVDLISGGQPHYHYLASVE